MRILVLGAGGVGGYFGGRLAAAGADVTFLVRQRRADQLAAHGLTIRSPAGDLALPAPRTFLAGAGAGAFDIVLLTCKAYDLGAAIETIAPHVGAATAVLPLLNGMAHLDALDARFGSGRVLGGLCQIAATLTPDGEIRHLNDIHRVIYGARHGAAGARVAAHVTALAAVMADANFVSRPSDDILLEMWEKWVMLAPLAAMTCLMRGTVGDVMATDDGKGLAEQLVAECAAIAAAAGHAPREKVLADSRARLTQPGSGFTASMLRDIERGGPTEGSHILGDLIARGAALGVAAPLLRVAHCHVQVYEARRVAA